MTADWLSVIGMDQQNLVSVVPNSHHLVHRDVFQSLLTLQLAASQRGFRVGVASAFRSFERQCLIWNEKASGRRAVLDDSGNRLDISLLSEDDLLFAILRWSAVPGCSRHHWGSDLDIYDVNAVQPGYSVQLTMDECVGDGCFAHFHRWLSDFLSVGDTGFFRPFAQDAGGIAPEPWHISHAPTAYRFLAQLNEAHLIDWLEGQDIALMGAIRKHWSLIFRRYILLQPA